ncbi:MAG: calcium/sodium antiporter [Clostridiales bacterium]|nr:calcium/sodium antiporter [Clostridiales bacterium]
MVLMVVFLIAGFVLLVKGADFFVDGACALSNRLKIPAYIVGLTVVAFGTSLPEAAVSITASVTGSNEIAIGNVIGSNMFNTLVVLGMSAIIAPVAVKRDMLRRDFPFCIGITVLLAVLLVTLNGGETALTRLDGIALLVMFVIFMAGSVMPGKKNQCEASPEQEKPMSWTKCLILIAVGIAGVIAGGQLTVMGAKAIALAAGLTETVIGLTVVAVGTSLPELVTSVVAAKKGQNDIAVGNAIGSNIFNILFILGMSAVIGDMGTDGYALWDVCILTGIMALVYVIALAKKKITRPAGIVMILIYGAYTAFLLIR